MKVYEGRRLNPEEKTVSPTEVLVDSKPLKHYVRHSPDGFNWGYGGSGPAELARCILIDFFGEKPKAKHYGVAPKADRLYQKFKWAFVGHWKEQWRITSEEIENWLKLQEELYGEKY
jgi:hypothetical protein